MAGETLRSVPGTAALLVKDATLEAAIRDEFSRAGFETYCARNEGALLETCHRNHPTIAVVDWANSVADFLSLCRRLAYGMDVAVMTIVPEGNTALRLRALTAGADDCVDPGTPPVEVVARARAILRRKALNGSKAFLSWGPISLNLLRFQAFVDGIPVKLTAAEFRILKALVENRGRVLTREQLLVKIHAQEEREAGSRTVDTHVYSLRKKLGPYGGSIRTVRGGGYSLDLSGELNGRMPYGLAAQLVYRLASPLVVVDSDMRIVFVNEAAASLLGVEMDKVPDALTCRELLKCTVDGKVPVMDKDCFGLRALALASSNPSVTYFIRATGQPVKVEAVYTYLEPAGAGKYLAILLRPSQTR